MEIYGTIWVCRCCMLTHANGECCANDDHGGDGIQPWSAMDFSDSHVVMGMSREDHSEDCDSEECDCEKNTYSTSQCEGCGSWLHGERHAMTLFKD